ncbi:MAG: ATP-dependent DNA helicase RecG [Deltaproteobacteria bacterium]|nr:ATP-dependent DNA helicase RecG [Deltaproteobacteria bacterium]
MTPTGLDATGRIPRYPFMNDLSHSITALKSAIATALMGGEDPAAQASTLAHINILQQVDATDRRKLEACLEAIKNPNAFADTNRKVVLARAQRFLTSLAIELSDRGLFTDVQAPQPMASAVPRPTDEGEYAPLLSLKGIGPKSAQRLLAYGIQSPLDLLFLLPRRYEDRRTICPIAELKPGMRAVTVGVVEKVSVFGRPWKRIMQVEIRDGDHRLLGMWFSNRRPNSSSFVKGQKIKMAGLVGNYRNSLQMAHPAVAREGEQNNAMDRILPIYPDIPGIPGATVEKAIHSALDTADSFLTDPVPPTLLGQHRLIPLKDALRLAHIPPEDVDISALDAWVNGSSPAHRRLAYDEFLFIQLALGLRKSSESAQGAPTISPGSFAPDRSARLLGFKPTSAQRRVIDEILQDMARGVPMRRLLQGDVGSGKTMVALDAIAACVDAGYQAALMAPTEILAEQHMRTLFPVLKQLGIHTALHMGNARTSARKKFIEQTASGRVQVAIGTHALISESVVFANLGLAVVDEQHRFGVAQRLGLQGKAKEGKAPHLLVMTATPIPRSLALTVHGDLDISVLDELPPGRMPVHTEFVSNESRETVVDAMEAALSRKEQVYVVCPIIEQSDVLDVSDAETTHAFYASRFGDDTVGLLHGRLPAEERDMTMDRFIAGELGVLVCTTVIEVGVNVPNATLMVIEGCERFGLAQLHQLRGRVGRGTQESRCILTGTPNTSESQMRIDTLTRSTDGFYIAEQDLQIRGPGELYGRRQAGLPGFRFGNLKKDLDLLQAARQDALNILTRSPRLECSDFATLGAELKRRILAGEGPVGEESG